MINTPESCSQCRGGLPADIILEKFVGEHTDYGHAMCGRCGISFDTNVNEMVNAEIQSADEISLLQEEQYKEHFIEDSKIANDEGDIYTNFGWDDNNALKEGIASYVVDAVKNRHENDLDVFVDLGCGSGFMSSEIARRFPNVTVHAIDPSPLVKRLEGRKGILPHQGTLQTACLEPGSVDAMSIIGNWMLHADPILTLAGAQEVLKASGTIVLDFKNIKSFSRIVARWALKLGLDRYWGRELLQRNFIYMRYGYNKKFVIRVLQEQGFRIVETKSKPPRLLEFGNQSEYQLGVKGLVWRIFNWFDLIRDEQAWIQIVAEKE